MRKVDATMPLRDWRLPLRSGSAVPDREILDRFYGRVLGFAFQVLGDTELAAQAAERIFVQAPPPDSEIAVWRAAMTTLGRYVERGFVVRPLLPLAQGWQADLLQQLAVLPPLDRALLLLRYHEGLEPDALAEVLELPEPTVRARIAAVRSALIDVGGSL